MKPLFKPANLPTLAVGLGFLAQVLRRLLYAVAVDEKNLLVPNHPLELMLGALSFAVLVWIVLSVRKLDGSGAYEDNFFPSRGSLWGHLAAAAGILLTVLTTAPGLGGYVGKLWQLMGYAAPLCLAAAGIAREKGKKPFFLLDLSGCLFLLLHIITRYQSWCANSQLQDYAFALFGAIALMLFAFYTAAFAADLPQRRMQLGMGLAAVYLLTAELAVTEYSWLSLGGIVWALTDLCTLEPRPRQEAEPAAEEKM